MGKEIKYGCGKFICISEQIKSDYKEENHPHISQAMSLLSITQ